MAVEYQMPRTDLLGWRLKIGEDNHGQHKWVYLPKGPAREAWPQTKMDKYAIGLEMVRLSPLRIGPVVRSESRRCRVTPVADGS